MHASIDELLSLRDGQPVDATVRAHALQCPQCLAQSERLVQTRARLQALASFDAPSDAWLQIQRRAEQGHSRARLFGLAAALAVVAIGVVAFVATREPVAERGERIVAEQETASQSDELQKLMQQSRALDELLETLPDRPQVQRASLVATVDSMEERIQWLDWQLATQSDAGLDRVQSERLWTERVELMDSLVKVRYAESAPMAF